MLATSTDYICSTINLATFMGIIPFASTTAPPFVKETEIDLSAQGVTIFYTMVILSIVDRT